MSANKSQKQCVISRWRICGTLGKGRYSWTKKGQDIKTGKIVALTFTPKSDLDIVGLKEQAKQIQTEIETLKNIRHPNVRKLYAYNLNAQCPLSSIHSILFVFERVAGGELFDILHYASTFTEIVARTYFKQLINGLEACHDMNLFHRNLKPQHLLLDNNYNLKIVNFGCSQIIHSNSDAIGTNPYEAPELLLNAKYTAKCDIFSAGVILFILLAGYPPFNQASKKDMWFKNIMEGKIAKFWKAHKKCTIAKNAEAKDLLILMLSFRPSKRIDINGIKSHKWCKGEILKGNELITEILDQHSKAEEQRRKDARKSNDVATSLNSYGGIPGVGIEKFVLKTFPDEFIEGMFGETYTFLEPRQHVTDLYDLLENAICGPGRGSCRFDFDTQTLNCEMRVAHNNYNGAHAVTFGVEIFESRMWKNRYLELNDSTLIAETVARNEHQIYVIRIKRIYGDTLMFNNIKKRFMLTYCSPLIKGLPKWARKMEKLEVSELEMLRRECLVSGYVKQSIESLFDDHIISICFEYYCSKRKLVIDSWLMRMHYCRGNVDDAEYYKELGDIFVNDNEGGIKLNNNQTVNKEKINP